MCWEVVTLFVKTLGSKCFFLLKSIFNYGEECDGMAPQFVGEQMKTKGLTGSKNRIIIIKKYALKAHSPVRFFELLRFANTKKLKQIMIL